MNRLSNRPSPPDESELWFQLGSNEGDRKSTRLNSSHGYISYAVFCLKKKKKTDKESRVQEKSAHDFDHRVPDRFVAHFTVPILTSTRSRPAVMCIRAPDCVHLRRVCC